MGEGRFFLCDVNKSVILRVELVTQEQRRFSRKKPLTAWPPEEPTRQEPPSRERSSAL